MEDIYEENPPPRSRPFRTLTVFVLLLIAALVFSYLGAFAVTDALAKADLIESWSAEHDPRMRWMMNSFGYCVGTFLVIAILMKWSSWRQMQNVDELDE